MKPFEEFLNESNTTRAKHAEITRSMKSKVADLQKQMHDAVSAHAEAVRALEAHRMKDPFYAKKKDASWANYREQGRSTQLTHNGAPQ